MKTFKSLLTVSVLLLGFQALGNADQATPTATTSQVSQGDQASPTATPAADQILKTGDLTVNLGGRFQELGELELVTNDPLRDHTRVYLFNVEDRLIVNGDYKGTDYWFETAFGGEAYSTSNNQINLLEYDANVPLADGVSIMAGQFKEPANLESADYDGYLLFTEKSELMTIFFNMGYDGGVALSGKSGDLDAIVGVEDGAADLPQRYLPEFFNFPPMTFLRLGITDGIKDDPWHPRQTDFDKPDNSQFAVHVNGIYLNDSNAGHSTDAALQSSYVTVGSATTDDYGNFMMSGEWNPYLGKTAPNYGPVSAAYWQASLDAQYRAPLGDTVFALQGQVNVAQFTASNFAPITVNGKVMTAGSLNIGGGEVMASVGDNPWVAAGRFAMVIPDNGFKYSYATGEYATITGSDPIYELTLPSITWKANPDTKLVAEAMWLMNTPTVFGGDGEYVIAEMPSQVSNATASTPITRLGLVPAGRMMFQFQF